MTSPRREPAGDAAFDDEMRQRLIFQAEADGEHHRAGYIAV
jgi:hypothetical protein